MSKVGSQLLGMEFYLYSTHLRKGGINAIRGKIDLLHNLTSTISALMISEDKTLSKDFTKIENTFDDIKELDEKYDTNMEFQSWAIGERNKVEIKIHELFREVKRIALNNDLLDLSYLQIINADMSQIKRKE